MKELIKECINNYKGCTFYEIDNDFIVESNSSRFYDYRFHFYFENLTKEYMLELYEIAQEYNFTLTIKENYAVLEYNKDTKVKFDKEEVSRHTKRNIYSVLNDEFIYVVSTAILESIMPLIPHTDDDRYFDMIFKDTYKSLQSLFYQTQTYVRNQKTAKKRENLVRQQHSIRERAETMLSLETIEKELDNPEERVSFVVYDVLNDFGLQIAGVLLEQNMSVAELADRLDITEDEMYNILQGGKEDITLKELARIAYTLNKLFKIQILS